MYPSFLQLLRAEIIKIFSRKRSFIGFAAIAAVVFLIQLAMYVDGENYIGLITQSIEQSIKLSGHIVTGNMVCFIILQTLIIQMPLLVALVTGDLISGEAQSGTIRLLLTKPVSREKILFVKFIAGLIYVIALILFLGILSYPLSLLIFGNGDMMVLKSDELVILQSADTVWRFIGAFFIAFLSLTVVSSLSLMLSCFTNNSITPIITTMSIIILFTIIGTLDVPIFETLKQFLFTTHMIIWRNLFDNPINVSFISKSIGVLTAQIALFYGISHYYFSKKDIIG
ncbi:MAG: ABC transporter permease subunit [Chitinophagales bacterium]|nr:ABC transporter permease subunit [Chitinophagales bacterium]